MPFRTYLSIADLRSRVIAAMLALKQLPCARRGECVTPCGRSSGRYMSGDGDGDGDDAGAACDACDHSSTEHGQS